MSTSKNWTVRLGFYTPPPNISKKLQIFLHIHHVKVKFVIFALIFGYRYLQLGSMIKILFNNIIYFFWGGGRGMELALGGLTLKGILCPIVFHSCYVYMYVPYQQINK